MTLKFAKVIRDPIHGFISLTEEEVKVLDSTVFQRLRGIKQLAMTDYVFPGAVHTRFEHALGTLHMTHRILRRLEEVDTPFPEEDERATRLAAMLHDIGHGPFSHVAENFITFPREGDTQLGHAKASVDLVRMHPELQFLGEIRERVTGILADWEPPRTFLRDIVTGPLDADKMDYLLRDSHYTGVQYGVTDVERIIYTLVNIPDLPGTNRSFLGVLEKGREAVESLVLARYFMHNQVYLHHTRLICDAMLSRAVSLAVQDDAVERERFEYRSDLGYLMEYLKLVDSSLLQVLADCPSEAAKEITNMLQMRRLFKTVFRREVSKFDDVRVRSRLLELSKDDMEAYEQEIAEASDLPPETVILARQSLTKPTYRGTPSKDILDVKTILIQGEDGAPEELEQISPIFRAIGDRIPVSISCYSNVEGNTSAEREERREQIGAAVEDVIQAMGG